MENNNNIDFKDLWKQQSVSPPNMEEMISKLKHFKSTSMRKLVKTNVMLMATTAFIIFIWYRFQPEFLSTKIGIILIILAMVIYLFAYNKLAGFYKTIDSTQNNNEYLQKLILYFILLGSGLCLYMYEYTSRMTFFWGGFTYLIMLGWVGFSWFYFRPKEIKKEQARVNALITKFEEVNSQLDIDL